MPTKIATALARGASFEAAALCREVRARLDGQEPVLLAALDGLLREVTWAT
jgi:hypothetical protein